MAISCGHEIEARVLTTQVWIHDVSVSLGGPLLLDGATLPIEAGERIGLLGRNGTGKSTLLRILCGDIPPDSGEIVKSSGTRVALLPQDVSDTLPGTVYEIVASGGQGHLDVLRQLLCDKPTHHDHR